MTGDRLTVGVVTPHAAPGPEVELPAMTRAGSTTSWPAPALARPDLRASTSSRARQRRARPSGRGVDAVAHASTTTGYVIGAGAEADLVERLSQPVRRPGRRELRGGRRGAAGRAASSGSSWCTRRGSTTSFDELGAAYFRGQGFEAVVTRATELPDDPARVAHGHVVDWVEQHLEDRAEALFLAGNGFRAAAAVEELERRTGRLVVSANQALLWGVLGATGRPWTLTGHGRLLQTRAPDPACWDAC